MPGQEKIMNETIMGKIVKIAILTQKADQEARLGDINWATSHLLLLEGIKEILESRPFPVLEEVNTNV